MDVDEMLASTSHSSFPKLFDFLPNFGLISILKTLKGDSIFFSVVPEVTQFLKF